ncbi:hypothetical protein GCM10010413_24780 [Promicromonospora sukumoe]|uniref:Hydroxymethylpyrimidine pyrophosphatase-like HAD family hydrolase n=1 Tax=Promicromonospora sukumoe TaxID=88382 RepID=A0A7W3PDT4_9MICO|nr:HAD family hydrolase [Promicromonospora sukumoe]MBA8808305.1 hydroxymethylpyrimidine pyrophosphatase-like HAD family hydrolase [Promicromonospora sukumoe]
METTAAHGVSTSTKHLIALDIDGTLVGRDDKVRGETVRALELVRASGHQVVLATGRSLVGLVSVARRLGLSEGWAVCSNGAVTVRLDRAAPSGHEVIECRTFAPGPVVRQAWKLAPGLHVAVEEIGWGWRVSRQLAPGLLNGPQKLTRLDELLAEPASRVVLHADRMTARGEGLHRLGATVTPAGPDWLDVTAPGTSKATALELVRQRLGIPVERTLAVGDGVNDIPMLSWAARSVAMGHAPDAVRTAAAEVTGSISVEGVVPILRSLVPGHALRPDLSPLAAQLLAAVHTAPTRSPGRLVVRVWHGSGPGLAGCAIYVLRGGRWERHAPVPSGTSTTMRDVERAAREAGLTYPRGEEGRRRAHWRTAPIDRPEASAAFELPLTPPERPPLP